MASGLREIHRLSLGARAVRRPPPHDRVQARAPPRPIRTRWLNGRAHACPKAHEWLPPWLARRLGVPDPGRRAPEDPAEDRALIARALAFLFLSGATISLLWLQLPHEASADETGIVAMTVGGYAVGILLIVGFDRLPLLVLKASVTAATIVITGALLANHENGSVYVFFYFWATVYAFSFFSLRQALAQTALVGVAFGVRPRRPARHLAGGGRALDPHDRHDALRRPARPLPHRRAAAPLAARPADRAGEPPALPDGARRGARGRRARTSAPGRWRCSSSTSTASSTSTTRSGTRSATACWRRSPSACSPRPGPDDLTARFGGDEFALLCRDVSHEDDALAIGRRINEALAAGFQIGEHELRVSASVGDRALRAPGRRQRHARARRRRGHVRRQGARARALRAVRPVAARPDGRAAEGRERPAARARARPARGPLPADRLAGEPAHRRRRGADPLAPPRARARLARPSSSPSPRRPA